MKAKQVAFALAAGALALAGQARANSAGTPSDISLLDTKDLQFLFGGFAEADYINDSTQSFTEVVGNNPVKPQTPGGGVAGNDGRTQFSIRNSRFDFSIIGPSIDGWTDYGYMEFDLLGYDPQPAVVRGQQTGAGGVPAGTVNSETGFWENPTLRVRHMYAAAFNGSFKFLAGQYWDLFGFSPDYVMDTLSESPVRGDLYERTPQLTAFYTMGGNSDPLKVETALSMERPVQDSSQVPGFDAALRFDLPGWVGAYTSSSSSRIHLAQANLAVSGKVNTFAVPNQLVNGQSIASNDVSKTSFLSGEAIAVTSIIPVIPVSSSSFLSSLVLTGEFSAGSGYADEFSGWSGGETNFAYNPATGANGPALPNLDAGQGGFYGDNSFHLMNLQSFNFTAQYQLPSTWTTYLNTGYSQLYSDNMAAMANNPLNFGANTGGPGAVNGGAYNLVTGWYANISHDWSANLRTTFEYDRFTTTYVNRTYAVDNRLMLSFFYIM